jgi:parallel beta-helix repeat protein
VKRRIDHEIMAVSIGLLIIASGGSVIVSESNALDVAATSHSIIYVPDNYSRIQGAVDSATSGDTIIVRDGVYFENVKVNKRVTIESENGAAYTIVHARKPNDHVFEVTADYVSISGLTVKSASGLNRVGMYIHAGHCTISNNTAMDNPYGFFLNESRNNTLINNIASDNEGAGIYLYFSSGNTLSNNTVVSSKRRNGIRLYHSHSNTLCNNNASNNMWWGIRLTESHNNKIMNNDLHSNKNDGICLESSNNNLLVYNSANSNTNGFCLESSHKNTMMDNYAQRNNGAGFSLLSSHNNTLANNTATANNEFGISLDASSNCIVTGNIMDANDYNFGVSSTNRYHVIHEIDPSNLVDGKPIYYWVGQQNREIPDDAGFVGIINSLNITVKDLTLTNNSAGVLLAYSMLSRIENVSSSNNIDGIALSGSINNIIINTTNVHNERGINCTASNTNLIAFNTIEHNHEGLVLNTSNNNFITMNTISNNCYFDELLEVWTCIGIDLFDSHNNVVFLNNFMNNRGRVVNSATTWNFISEITYIYNGKLHTNYMGNYWSDYIKKIQIEQDSDRDGIGECPPYHIITLEVRDYYPLMKPFEEYIYVM